MLIDRVRDVLENYEEDIKINMELMCGASLAHHSLLGSMRKMVLRDVDMSTVPAQHLASLASCVTSELIIKNVSHGACEMWPKGSDVSQRFCQRKKLVNICMESEQLKMKSNPGKFWRKCSFSDF